MSRRDNRIAAAAVCLVGGLLLAGWFSFGRPRAASVDPAVAEQQFTLGVEARQRGDLRGAAEAFRRASDAAPGWADPHAQLGAVYTDALEFELALTSLKRATAIEPADSAIWVLLGKLYLQTSRTEDAIDTFRKALDLRPGHPPILSLVAESLRQSGEGPRAVEAAQLFEQAAAADPTDPDRWYRLGLTYQRLNRHEDAIKSFVRAIAISPETPEPYYALAMSERAAKRLDRANRALAAYARASRAAGKRDPQSAPNAEESGEGAPAPTDVLVVARRKFYNEGRPEEALSILDQAGPWNSADMSYFRGLVLQFLGRRPEAESAFRRAAELDPRNPRPRAWLGTLLLEQGPSTLQAAMVELRAAVGLDPDYAYGNYQLGRALLQQGKPSEAVAPLRRALTRDPGYREALYSLSQALRQLGKTAEYRSALARFKKLDNLERRRRTLATQVRARPTDPAPRLALARHFLETHSESQAVLVLEGLLSAVPNHDEGRRLLEVARARGGRSGAAEPRD